MTNQPPPLDGFDPLSCDPALARALTRHAPDASLTDLAREAGSAPAREHGPLADLHHPVLHTHDRSGRRIDEVEFHSSWHWLMGRAVAPGLHAGQALLAEVDLPPGHIRPGPGAAPIACRDRRPGAGAGPPAGRADRTVPAGISVAAILVDVGE